MATIYNEDLLADYIAHMPGTKKAVYEFTKTRVLPVAQGIFAQHDHPGGHSIKLDQGITDSYVVLEGPVPHIVEWGRKGYKTEKPQPIGNRVVPAGTWIGGWEGSHVLRRTHEAM